MSHLCTPFGSMGSMPSPGRPGLREATGGHEGMYGGGGGGYGVCTGIWGLVDLGRVSRIGHF